MQLNLEIRKRLSVAAMTIRQPVVIVQQRPQAAKPAVKGPKAETHEQAELRRERVEAITRKAPEIVITSKAVYVLNNQLDAVNAVPMRLPIMARIRNWLRTE